MIKMPFGNPTKVVIAIIIFLLIFFWYRSADAGEMTGTVELGMAFAQEPSGTMLVFTERLADKYDLGATLISDQEAEGVHYEHNGNVFAQRIVKAPKSAWGILPDEMGLGAAYWIHTDEELIGCQLGFHLSMRWFIKGVPITLRHWSNASTCKPNQGQDGLTIAYPF